MGLTPELSVRILRGYVPCCCSLTRQHVMVAKILVLYFLNYVEPVSTFEKNNMKTHIL